ncbi:MAG: hypothetical protein JWQ90_1723 [Hydrocarboniphaga sp.]|uniref:DUF4124 domain-containing protein n=1 Tax=Hydrocarboniphaga sp. TaxID=2033016 RepID=UPI0026148C95|nr:DUF4124 domain-containing protein [Hydrocarboniphaga sp.]MDB5969273.1 hypothetical protein [Hydrocarboniphaga sp.]
MRKLLFLPLLLIALPAQAEIYRWVDAEGHAHYGDKAPTPGAKPVQLPPLQFISGGANATAAAALAPGKAEPPTPAIESVMLSIVSPTPDQTLRGTDRKLSVAINLQKPLPEGAGLVYLLDGNARTSKPVQDLSYTMGDVDRGTHLVAVAVVDGRGKELGRAAPVLVHIKPPGIN